MKKIISLLLTFSLLLGAFVLPTMALTKQPVVHLTFDGNLKDTSGNGYDGSAEDADITYDTGAVGQAAKIDNAMVTLAGSSAINWDKEFSVSLWVRLDPDVASGSIINVDSTSEETDRPLFEVWSSYDDSYITTTVLTEYIDDATYADEATYYNSEYIAPEKNMDKFMHLVIVYNGTKLKYYLDGVLDGSTDIPESSSGNLFGLGENIVIGGSNASTYFHGYMDDLQIFTSAITFDDVKALYQEGVVTTSNKIVLTIDDPYMMVNGTKQEIDPGRGTAPIVNSKSRTILPIRAIIETMGGTIGWDGSTQKVTVNLNGKTIYLWINKDKAEVDGVMKEIDPGKYVTPELINGRTMLPIRFILSELGLPPLEWDGNLRQITIFY